MYCEKCKITISGDKTVCPLCGNELPEGDAESGVFPVLAPKKPLRGIALKIISFVSLAMIVLCFAGNMIFSPGSWWALPASAGIGCCWIVAALAVVQRKHFFTNVTMELLIVCGGAVLWDLCTMWKGWSLDFVIPCACMTSMVVMVAVSLVRKIPSREYLLYIGLAGIYGIVPVAFIFTGVLNVALPSIICAAGSIITIAAIMIFQSKKIFYELGKKFHI